MIEKVEIHTELTKHPSGATSSKVSDYAQIPKHSLDRLAARFAYGEKIHGRHNWKKGLHDKSYLIDRLNHVICHTLTLIEELERGELGSDDNAAAIMWGGMFACEATKIQFMDKKPPEFNFTGQVSPTGANATLQSTVDGKPIEEPL